MQSGMLLAPIRSYRVSISHQSGRRIRVCISHQSEHRFCPLFERCSNFNEEMEDSERAVREMKSSFIMRNVSFSVFLTYILSRFMRNAILLDR